MRNKNDRFGRIFLDFGKEIIAFALEGLITDCQNLIKHQNVALCLDGHGKGQSDLHAAGVVFQLLIHEFAQLGKIDDFVVHGCYLVMREAEKRAIQKNVLPAGQFRIETHAKLDERHQLALNIHTAVFRHIDSRDDFQQGGLARAISSHDAEEIALMHLKVDVFKDNLLSVPFDSLGPVDESLL